MNRHQALAHFTRDHVIMLKHARALHAAATTSPQAGLEATRVFQQYWDQVVQGYLTEVERVVQPAITEVSLQGRFNMLSTAMRNAMDELRVTMMEPSFFRASLFTLANALRTYVQYAEGHMLTDLQIHLDDQQLAKIRAQSVAVRKQVRPRSLGNPPTEPTFL